MNFQHPETEHCQKEPKKLLATDPSPHPQLKSTTVLMSNNSV